MWLGLRGRVREPCANVLVNAASGQVMAHGDFHLVHGTMQALESFGGWNDAYTVQQVYQSQRTLLLASYTANVATGRQVVPRLGDVRAAAITATSVRSGETCLLC